MNIIIGRFQGLSKTHVKLISEADVVVIIDSGKISKRNPFSFETRKRMIDKVFGGNIEVCSYKTGYIPDILNYLGGGSWAGLYGNDCIICGDDRIKGYKEQFKGKDIWFKTHIRDDNISGTWIRNSLIDNNESKFKESTHPLIWDMYNELREELIQALK